MDIQNKSSSSSILDNKDINVCVPSSTKRSSSGKKNNKKRLNKKSMGSHSTSHSRPNSLRRMRQQQGSDSSLTVPSSPSSCRGDDDDDIVISKGTSNGNTMNTIMTHADFDDTPTTTSTDAAAAAASQRRQQQRHQTKNSIASPPRRRKSASTYSTSASTSTTSYGTKQQQQDEGSLSMDQYAMNMTKSRYATTIQRFYRRQQQQQQQQQRATTRKDPTVVPPPPPLYHNDYDHEDLLKASEITMQKTKQKFAAITIQNIARAYLWKQRICNKKKKQQQQGITATRQDSPLGTATTASFVEDYYNEEFLKASEITMQKTKQKFAAITIQNMVRIYIFRRQRMICKNKQRQRQTTKQDDYDHQEEFLQASERAMQQTKQKFAAITIQSIARAHVYKQRYQTLLLSKKAMEQTKSKYAIVIQRAYRRRRDDATTNKSKETTTKPTAPTKNPTTTTNTTTQRTPIKKARSLDGSFDFRRSSDKKRKGGRRGDKLRKSNSFHNIQHQRQQEEQEDIQKRLQELNGLITNCKLELQETDTMIKKIDTRGQGEGTKERPIIAIIQQQPPQQPIRLEPKQEYPKEALSAARKIQTVYKKYQERRIRSLQIKIEEIELERKWELQTIQEQKQAKLNKLATRNNNPKSENRRNLRKSKSLENINDIDTRTKLIAYLRKENNKLRSEKEDIIFNEDFKQIQDKNRLLRDLNHKKICKVSKMEVEVKNETVTNKKLVTVLEEYQQSIKDITVTIESYDIATKRQRLQKKCYKSFIRLSNDFMQGECKSKLLRNKIQKLHDTVMKLNL